MSQPETLCLQKRLLNCQKCPRLKTVTPYPLVQVSWCSNPSVITVGRNPGLEHNYSDILPEDLQDFYNEHWLKSRYGKYIVNEFGPDFVKDHLFGTNICKCSSPKNTNLYQVEIENCLPYLLEQLDYYNPKFILIFGSEAFSTLNPYLETSGRFWKYKNSKVVKLLHPAYFLYKQNEIEKKLNQSKILQAIKKIILNTQ